MASLLPRTTSEFADPKYWQSFFKNRGDSPFEWYGDLNQLGPFLEKYLKINDRILQIGCGNSILADQLCDSGFRNITSIDSVVNVINKQKSRNKTLRPSLEYACVDATKTEFQCEFFNVIVDKGTLDALFPPDCDQLTKETVISLFNEIDRILSPGGRYVTVSLCQKHIMRLWMEHFSHKNFMLRVHQCVIKTDSLSEKQFMMPVFLLIATKLKPALQMPTLLEFCSGNSKPFRVHDIQEILSNVQAAQEYSWFCHKCLSMKLNNCAEITMNDSKGQPRLKVSIVDARDRTEIQSYAVMIVPQGRENEWLFSTVKGEQCLRMQTKQDRLSIVSLCRGQNYTDLESIKSELNNFIMDFAPLKARDKKIQYLTISEDVGYRQLLDKGYSQLSGEFVVENVKIDHKEYRRLVFLSSQNLIQSEALLVSPRKKQKKSSIDLDTLTCDHHNAMLMSLGLFPHQSPLKLCVLGLGGGLLATYLNRKLPKASIIGVELDDAIVEIGKKWFDFCQNDKLEAVIQDGIDFLENTVKNEEKFDIIFVDVAGSMHEDGLSCPLPAFVENRCLENMKRILEPSGCLVLNLVTRDEDKSEEVKRTICAIFPTVICHSVESEVNEILFCLSDQNRTSTSVVQLMKSNCNSLYSHIFTQNLSEKFENMKVL